MRSFASGTESGRFDIYERVFQFAVEVIRFTRTLPRSPDGFAVARQMVAAGTSVGANMEEANGAERRRDFIHKVRIARKEARLRLRLAAELGDPAQAQLLIQESGELVRILSRIAENTARASGGQRTEA